MKVKLGGVIMGSPNYYIGEVKNLYDISNFDNEVSKLDISLALERGLDSYNIDYDESREYLSGVNDRNYPLLSTHKIKLPLSSFENAEVECNINLYVGFRLGANYGYNLDYKTEINIELPEESWYGSLEHLYNDDLSWFMDEFIIDDVKMFIELNIARTLRLLQKVFENVVKTLDK